MGERIKIKHELDISSVFDNEEVPITSKVPFYSDDGISLYAIDTEALSDNELRKLLWYLMDTGVTKNLKESADLVRKGLGISCNDFEDSELVKLSLEAGGILSDLFGYAKITINDSIDNE